MTQLTWRSSHEVEWKNWIELRYNKVKHYDPNHEYYMWAWEANDSFGSKWIWKRLLHSTSATWILLSSMTWICSTGITWIRLIIHLPSMSWKCFTICLLDITWILLEIFLFGTRKSLISLTKLMIHSIAHLFGVIEGPFKDFLKLVWQTYGIHASWILGHTWMLINMPQVMMLSLMIHS